MSLNNKVAFTCIILFLMVLLPACLSKQSDHKMDRSIPSNQVADTTAKSLLIKKDEKCVDTRGEQKKAINDSLNYIPVHSLSQKNTWRNEWNVYIANAIDSFGSILLNTDSLPLIDIERLCTGFKDFTPEKKKVFWALTFASIAKFESNFDTSCRYQEPASLNHIYSEGLLQLSYGDEKNFPGSPIDKTKQNILNPKVNLTSGVIILSKQIRKRKTLFTQKHYYWSVLTNKQNEIISFFKKHAEAVNFCQ